jgi:DNA-binding GntR family transcriptional regulator
MVYVQLRRRIVDGSLPPGSRIDQDAEAEALGVSRMPLREALRRLEAEGLVSVVRHGGAFVRDLSLGDLDDLYLLRAALEGLAGRIGTEQLSDTELNEMKCLVPSMEAVVRSPDLDAWLNVDWEFHSIIYGAAGHPRLFKMIRMLLDESARYRHLILADPEEVRLAFGHHREIIFACEQRDGERVEGVIRASIEKAHKRLRSLIEASLLAEDADDEQFPSR